MATDVRPLLQDSIEPWREVSARSVGDLRYKERLERVARLVVAAT